MIFRRKLKSLSTLVGRRVPGLDSPPELVLDDAEADGLAVQVLRRADLPDDAAEAGRAVICERFPTDEIQVHCVQIEANDFARWLPASDAPRPPFLKCPAYTVHIISSRAFFSFGAGASAENKTFFFHSGGDAGLWSLKKRE